MGCDWRGALLLRLRAEVVLLGRFLALDVLELGLTVLLFVEVDGFFAVVRFGVAAAEALPNKHSTRMRVSAFRKFKVLFYHRLLRSMA